MLNILWMIMLIIILFIIILLLIGIKIKVEYDKKGSEVKGCLKILIFKKIKIYSRNFPSKDEKIEEDEDEDEEKDTDIKKIFDLAKPCLKDLLDYLKTVLKSMKIKTVQNHLVFGMASYADTGKYIGIIWGVLSVINSMHEKLSLSAEPSFAGSVLDGNGINELEIYPLKVVIPTIRLLSKKEIRALIRGVLDE
ncbi:DUF2953 domain-containing protein [Methanobrevibacter sp.]|uniref:DUF2953 domain-containing protein n=1 Tax=Methanobrevibacter sp. TaxID=66852 RepID=UPI0025E4B19F|nr:DUF2953 domain-containing protein [Methanobrevibacter sp.]MBQ2666183.1 DUF2953 domain-containing protein [Methanobrevibacter sp.]